MTYPDVGDNPEKSGLIPHVVLGVVPEEESSCGRVRRGVRPISWLVG